MDGQKRSDSPVRDPTGGARRQRGNLGEKSRRLRRSGSVKSSRSSACNHVASFDVAALGARTQTCSEKAAAGNDPSVGPSSSTSSMMSVHNQPVNVADVAHLLQRAQSSDGDVDSVPAMVHQLQELLHYFASRPTLHHESASVARDYFRTMVAVSAAKSARKRRASDRPSKATLSGLRPELLRRIFALVDGCDLETLQSVNRSWYKLASDDSLWKPLCVREWPAFESDPAVWKLVGRNIDLDDPQRWMKMWRVISRRPKWYCRLQKTQKFLCNLAARQVAGDKLEEAGVPSTLKVYQRFDVDYLHRSVSPNAAVLYFEPKTEHDRPEFEKFVEYLVSRTRAGLALHEHHRFIFVPPCDYAQKLNYSGPSLLGIVQTAVPSRFVH